MMDNGTGKRMRTSSLTGETIVICITCGQPSADLSNCENCGCPLSGLSNDANLKRPRNGVNAAHALVSAEPAIAVPQSLYLNKNVTMVNAPSPPVVVPVTARPDVRPQALYVNVNNQAHSTAPSISSRPPLPTAPPGLTATSYTIGNGASPMLSVRTPNDAFVSSALMTNTAYSKSQPPAYGSTSQVVTSLDNPVVSVSNSTMSSTTPLAEPPPSSATSAEVSVNAFQIRIGTHKFLPLSPVTFKDDGILFTLRGYTHAPVLLNARAIMICKANLMFDHYPVLFLYLESSCMRQIRNIFSLTEDEFSGSSKHTLKRCITIFPNTSSDVASRSISQSIISIFASMSRKYPSMSRKLPQQKEGSNTQCSKILYLMSPDVAIDTLLARDDTMDTATAAAPVAPRTEPNRPPVVVSSMTTSSIPVPTNYGSAMVGPALISASMPRLPAQHSVPAQITHAAATPVSLHSNTMIQNTAPSNTPAVGAGGASAPVLKVPADKTQWLQMQKNLVIGGVYHVQTANGLREYCLWNGTQLVPCLVQNTEVQVDCTLVRIGSTSFSCVGQVRIKANTPSGIYFSVKRQQGNKCDIYLSQYDLVKCMICLDGIIPIIFLYVTNSGGIKIKSKCSLPHPGERYRHMLLFLKKKPNADQRDALIQMKFSSMRAKAVFEVIDIPQALAVLQKIDGVGKGGSLIGSNNLTNDQHNGSLAMQERSIHQIRERMKAELTTEHVSNAVTAQVRDTYEDDDDDVIMTSEEVGVKCPYTQQTMKEPMRNKVCGHNYERSAIMEFIIRKKGVAKCPYAGCGNQNSLQMSDLELNAELKLHIEKQQKQAAADNT